MSMMTMIAFFVVFLVSLCLRHSLQQAQVVPVEVGLVYDGLESKDYSEGKVVLSSVKMAISDFYSAHADYETRLVLNPRDSNNDVVDAAAAVLDLIKNVQVQAILGPRTSMQADFAIHLGEKAQVPIISFTASSPLLTSSRSRFLFLATQNDSTQVNAISALVQAFGWKEVVPIYIDDDYGRGILPYLIDALAAADVRLPHPSPISPYATEDQILEELYKLKTMQTRVFILHTSPVVGSKLITMAKEAEMISEGYVWILTDGMMEFFHTLNDTVVDSMGGILGVRPYVLPSRESKNFASRWKGKFLQDNPDANIDQAELDIFYQDIFARWAYDATTALAMAIEQAGRTNSTYDQANTSNKSSSTDLNSFGVSRNGPALLQALESIRFRGITGDFQFIDGQLPTSIFQILNVHDDGARRIGFWTPEKGLVKRLTTSTNSTTYSTSRSSLQPITWPGDSASVPKGWEIPTSGKKLRIGVPEKDGFREFVNVSRDPTTDATTVTGYSIEVFEAAVKALPYSLPYEYIPIVPKNYTDMIYQVYLGKFDAVVGDTTIRSDRSLYVDFTLPYTESGVKMIVRTRDTNNKNPWIFLKPLTWKLWLTSLCFFMWIAFVVWFLERRFNEEFHGSCLQQVATSFWFSLSTMVFAHRERLASNLTRVVVIVWCFVMLVLTQSYTASLSSLLTVQHLQPTVTSVNELIKRGENVGYLYGSFVQKLLIKQGFDKSKLVPYKTSEDFDRLFTLGSENGGIAAAFDEVPGVKLLMLRYCSKYQSVEPTYQADGLGFVFPKGSPLVSDISRAVLQVKEGDLMQKFERDWFGKQNNCSDPSDPRTYSVLDIDSFWALFALVGVTTLLALAIYIAMTVYYSSNMQERED